MIFVCTKWCYPKWRSTGTWIAHATHRLFLSGTYEFGKWNRRKIRGLGLLDKRGNGALYASKKKGKKIDALIFIWVRQCKPMELG